MLQKRVFGVDLTNGLDTKHDKFLTTKLTRMDNAIFEAESTAASYSQTISKAGGYTNLSNWTALDGNTISDGKRAATRKNELLVETATSLHSVLRGGTNGYTRRTSSFVRVGLAVTKLARASAASGTNFAQDVARSGNLSCWVWSESSTSVRVSVYDETTGAAYLARYDLSGGDSLKNPRVVATATQFVIITVRSADTSIGYNTISFTTPTTVSARTNWFTDANFAANNTTDAIYDSTSTRVYFAYHLAAGAGFKVAKTDAAALTIATSRSVADANHDPTYGCSVVRATNGTVIVSTIRAAGELRTCAIPDAMASETKLNIGTATGAVVGIETSTANRVMLIYNGAGSAGTTTSAQILTKVVVDTTPTVIAGPSTVARSLGVLSKPWIRSSQVFVGAQYYASLGKTNFVVGCGTDGSTSGMFGAVARFAIDGAGTATGDRTPSSVLTTSTTATFAFRITGDPTLLNGVDVTPTGTARVDLDFATTTQPLQRAEYADAAHFAGGLPLVYDGAQVFEAGFNYVPDVDAVVLADGGAGVLSAGAYSVRIVWEFTDSTGRRWQSVPSVAKSLTLGAGKQLAITAPSYRLTRMHDTGMTATVVAYITEANGTVYYRGQSAANTTSADTVALAYNQADTTLIGNELIYTTGDALEYEPFPDHRVGCIHQTRYFMAGLSENPYAVQYTDELADNAAPATNALYRIVVPPDKGKITALASMDGKVFFFCERGIWFAYGQGPNLQGLQSTYSPPELASPDLGCRIDSPDSVVLSPDGIWFQASQGFRFLTRGLTVARHPDGMFVGSEADTQLDGISPTNCMAALPVPGKPMIYFFVSNTFALVYNYQWQQWSKLTLLIHADAVVWNGSVTTLLSTGVVTTVGGGTINGVGVTTTIETGPIRFAGIAGFQRVYRMLLLGTKRASGATIRVYEAFDYATTFGSAYTLAVDAGIAVGDPISLRHPLSRQKCASIRIKIDDGSPEQDTFSLSNLSFEVGFKPGAYKLPAAQTF